MGMSAETVKNSRTVVATSIYSQNSISERPTAVYFERTWEIMISSMATKTTKTTRSAGSKTMVFWTSMFLE